MMSERFVIYSYYTYAYAYAYADCCLNNNKILLNKQSQ